MSGSHALVEAASLVEAREPFVLVTVVWRRGPSSGRQGYKAIVTSRGIASGWIGGACAEPTVIERARRCLETGVPELVMLGEGDTGESSQHGVASVPMACESDGALEVYMEPVLPPVRLVVVGRSPAVDALAAMGLALGWDAHVVDDGGVSEDHTVADIVSTKLDLGALVVDSASAVVVATQGHYDDIALAAALGTPAGYVGLVASPKRASSVLENLRRDGLDEGQIDRVHAPAGLDLGSVEHTEIAASIIADLVARRVRGELDLVIADTAAVQVATDPICGMTVHVADAKYHSLHDGVDYWFCASGCKRAFDADPVAALAPQDPSG